MALAQAGADVAINFHSHPEEAEQVAAEVRRAGRKAILCQGDVSDYSTVEIMVTETVRQFGRLDIAVTNAVFSDREPFFEADLKGFHRTIDVTMFGAFNLLRAAARQLIAQKQGGSLIVISSPHAYIPVPNAMAYNMAKAATDQMVRHRGHRTHRPPHSSEHGPPRLDRHARRTQIRQRRHHQSRRSKTSLGTHGQARGNWPRRRLLVRPGQRLHDRQFTPHRRRRGLPVWAKGGMAIPV